jgi:hypothetical protein
VTVTGTAAVPDLAYATCPSDHPYAVGGGGFSDTGGPAEIKPHTNVIPNAWEVDATPGSIATAVVLCSK